MNCKPGDLAIVVRSEIGNEGRIVEVLRRVFPGETRMSNCVVIQREDDWIVRGRLIMSEEVEIYADGVLLHRSHVPPREVDGEFPMPDNRLRPIRDTDGEDETLTWAPRREGVSA